MPALRTCIDSTNGAFIDCPLPSQQSLPTAQDVVSPDAVVWQFLWLAIVSFLKAWIYYIIPKAIFLFWFTLTSDCISTAIGNRRQQGRITRVLATSPVWIHLIWMTAAS